RLVVAEAEVVHELLHAHGVARRQLSAREEASNVGIRRGVHVGAKGRQRLMTRGLEAIRIDVRVAFSGLGIPKTRPRALRHLDEPPVDSLPGNWRFPGYGYGQPIRHAATTSASA